MINVTRTLIRIVVMRMAGVCTVGSLTLLVSSTGPVQA